MAECDNCGAWVDGEFKRVFSDNNGNLRACTNCGNHHGNDYTTPGGDRRASADMELGDTAPEDMSKN